MDGRVWDARDGRPLLAPKGTLVRSTACRGRPTAGDS